MTYHDGIVFEGFWKEGQDQIEASKHGLMAESTSVTGLTTSRLWCIQLS
jgi:hypothetical protein